MTAPDGQPLDRTGGAGCGTLTIADLPQSGVYELRVVDPGGFTGAYRFTATGTPYALGANAHLDLTDGTWTFTTTPGQRVFVDGTATVDGQPTPLTLTTGGSHTLTGSGTLYDVRDRPAISWTDLTPLTLAGTAVRVNDFIRLTNNGGNQAGAAWANTQVDPRGDLHTSFAVNMHDGGGNPADGIAFVLVDPAQPVLGQAGGGLGYTGLAPALAIEFDIYQNSGEPDANQVEILRNGSAPGHGQPGLPAARRRTGVRVGGLLGVQPQRLRQPDGDQARAPGADHHRRPPRPARPHRARRLHGCHRRLGRPAGPAQLGAGRRDAPGSRRLSHAAAAARAAACGPAAFST